MKTSLLGREWPSALGGPLPESQLAKIQNYWDARAKAKGILPKALFDYVDSTSAAWRSVSRQAPITWGWQRRQ